MTIMSVKAINTVINSNDKTKLDIAVKNAVLLAHRDGNIDPIININSKKKQLANGQKLLAYVNKHAPVKYDKKKKSPVYVRSEANPDMTEDDAMALPHLFEKAVNDPKFTVSKFQAKINKLELATVEQVTEELAALNAYIKEVEARFLELSDK